MKLIILREHLNSALSLLEKTLGSNELMPILKNVLVKAEKGKIQLIATNLETALIATLNGKIEEEGSVAVSGSGLFQIINNVKDEKIELLYKEQKLFVYTDMFQGDMVTVPTVDFPIIPKVKEEVFLDVDVKNFKKGLDTAFLAVSFNTIRPELNGVFLKADSVTKKLICVGTDGFRLAERRIDITHMECDSVQCIIPSKAVQILGRMLDGGQNIVRMIIEQNQCAFVVEGFTLISNLVDGEYPPYENFIPKEFDTEILVGKSSLNDAVRLSSVFSSRLNDITLQIIPHEEVVKVQSSNNVFGSGETRVQSKIRGLEQLVRVNARYFQDGIKSLDDANIKITIVNSEKPIKIESVTDKNVFYIIMPIKIA